ncbi:DUF6119 family protein [Aquibacillus albus]|uniref:Uncharacterized protein (TIGR04141 family) n=1 Tax=Aquibacillus albus TaxID=1168171 RepID=A0ABS2MZV8_9BACI|nr:DUF6119 family protein [Aquibacillus albus]MBM7571390.1 uncharacterized protein (TIGR04141 family) [Aquibacillus albus]
MEFSIYKLDTTRESFKDILINHYYMHQVGETKTQQVEKSIGENQVSTELVIEFYFRKDSNEQSISWYDYWFKFFDSDENHYKSVESAFGVIIIEIENHLYGISLGRGHHYTNKIADLDFGLDIAEIIIRENSIDIKSAKFFKQTKNKSLTQYNKNSFVTNEIGESNEMVIGKIDIDDKYQNWVISDYLDRAVFGTPLKINASNYDPSEIIEIVFEVHFISIYESHNRKHSFPRISILKNSEDNAYKIANLNTILLNELKSDKEQLDVSLSYFIENDGDILIEPINSDIELIYSRRKHEVPFDINKISQKIKELDVDDIEKVSIKPKMNPEKRIPLLNFLDFTTTYESKNYCLYKGNWAHFNASYIEFIEREITKVNEITTYNEEYNLDQNLLERGKVIIDSSDTYHNVSYTEYKYNVFLHDKYDFKLLDREREHTIFKEVEFADLYDETDANLIHVKIGSTKDLRYCIQQSLHSAELFNIHSNSLEEYEITIVTDISMLLVVDFENIFDSDGRIDFGKSKSIYFKTEVIEWHNRLRSLGFNPNIIVAKDLR